MKNMDEQTKLARPFFVEKEHKQVARTSPTTNKKAFAEVVTLKIWPETDIAIKQEGLEV